MTISLTRRRGVESVEVGLLTGAVPAAVMGTRTGGRLVDHAASG